MPGRLLKMSMNNASDGAKPAVNGKLSPRPGAVQAPATKDDTAIPGLPSKTALTNGDVHAAYPTPNGITSPSSPATAAIPESFNDLPEEVKHIAMDQHSLGALIQRVSAEAFNTLEQTINQMALLPVPTDSPMTNGTSSGYQQTPSLDQQHERNNKRKKKLILDYAADFRTKFIKLLVVTDWTRRDVKDLSKLIDLKVWLDDQDVMAVHTANSFYQMVREIRPFKLPNPDLETALAVLGQGDVPWMPHLGFREQKRLGAEEILQTLHRMNTIINMRLVLHEELIPQLRNYRVRDGRATFTFPNEFELDVYTASEDPEQPWFFLDVRFLFNPAPQITGEQLRAMVDIQINNALAEKGLRGACELAHDFVLTHKINIFQKQARELQRGIWANALSVDLIRRTLTVQYWTGSPQAKSWIEIGVMSGKDNKRRAPRSDDAISSQIKARWIRDGKEQKDVRVTIDFTNLSLESLLRSYVARHSSWILESIQQGLEEQAGKKAVGEERTLQCQLSASDSEPSDCGLQAQIGDHPATTLQIDGITGRLFLSPAGPATKDAQKAFAETKEPVKQGPLYLVRYLTYEIATRIDRLAETNGWDVMRHVRLSRESMSLRAKREVHRHTLFQPRGFKGSNWYIAYAINLHGETWWALEIDDPTSSTPTGISSQLRLPKTSTDDFRIPLTLRSLKQLEQSAVQAASLATTTKALVSKGVNTALQHVPIRSSPQDDPAAVPKTFPVLIARFSQLLAAKSARFGTELLSLQYFSFDTDKGAVRLVAKGKMRQPGKVQDVLQKTKDPDIAFALDGSFSLVVENKLGANPTPQVIARLSTLSTLVNLASTLRSRGFSCSEISFSKVCFTYATDQEVTLHFTKDRIKLAIPSTSPTYRVRPLLEEIVNDPVVGFERFTTALSYFLPVLRAFQTLELRHVTHFPGRPDILPRQVDYYRIQYPTLPGEGGGQVIAAFDLHFKRNKDELEWRVSDVLPRQLLEEREKAIPGFASKLGSFMRRVGKGWTGMRTLLVADMGGIEEAILELDHVVWSALVEARKSVKENAGSDVKQEFIMID